MLPVDNGTGDGVNSVVSGDERETKDMSPVDNGTGDGVNSVVSLLMRERRRTC
jgi:hypothetical protein